MQASIIKQKIKDLGELPKNYIPKGGCTFIISNFVRLCHWLLGSRDRVTRLGIWTLRLEKSVLSGWNACVFFGSSVPCASETSLDGKLSILTSLVLAYVSMLEEPENNAWLTLRKNRRMKSGSTKLKSRDQETAPSSLFSVLLPLTDHLRIKKFKLKPI